MPQSEHWAIPWILDVCDFVKPTSVLDIGIGMGEYGFLVRQKLDIGIGNLLPKTWELKIVGVEIFPDYANPIWDHYYNSVFRGDCRDFLRDSQECWDLVLMNDVIEHFERDEALKLIERIRKIAGCLVITTPLGEYPQGAEYGNIAETHLSTWFPSDFELLGGSTHVVHRTFLTVFSDDPRFHTKVKRLPSLSFPEVPSRENSLIQKIKDKLKKHLQLLTNGSWYRHP